MSATPPTNCPPLSCDLPGWRDAANHKFDVWFREHGVGDDAHERVVLLREEFSRKNGRDRLRKLFTQVLRVHVHLGCEHVSDHVLRSRLATVLGLDVSLLSGPSSAEQSSAVRQRLVQLCVAFHTQRGCLPMRRSVEARKDSFERALEHRLAVGLMNARRDIALGRWNTEDLESLENDLPLSGVCMASERRAFRMLPVL